MNLTLRWSYSYFLFSRFSKILCLPYAIVHFHCCHAHNAPMTCLKWTEKSNTTRIERYVGTLMKTQNRAEKPVLSSYWQLAMKSHWTVSATAINRVSWTKPWREEGVRGEIRKLSYWSPLNPKFLMLQMNLTHKQKTMVDTQSYHSSHMNWLHCLICSGSLTAAPQGSYQFSRWWTPVLSWKIIGRSHGKFTGSDLLPQRSAGLWSSSSSNWFSSEHQNQCCDQEVIK